MFWEQKESNIRPCVSYTQENVLVERRMGSVVEKCVCHGDNSSTNYHLPSKGNEGEYLYKNLENSSLK